MNIVVIGGGITGRLVQHVLGKDRVRVLDAGVVPRKRIGVLTREFGANYLWNTLPEITCRSFPVLTHVDGAEATVRSVRRYKAKIGKSGDTEPWGGQFTVRSTGYEIDMDLDTRVEYNMPVIGIDRFEKKLIIKGNQTHLPYDALISTIPMPSLLCMLPFIRHDHAFEAKPIYVRIDRRPPDAPHPVDTLYVNYISHEGIPPYRVTDRFGWRHFEGLTTMGTLPTKKIVPGKIYFNASARGIVLTLEAWDIYSIGRFATWDRDELVTHSFDAILRLKEKLT